MATYCTRIYVTVNTKELMEKLYEMDISDLGKGFYNARDIFNASSTKSNFYDSESEINEYDLKVLVKRIVEIIADQGTVLADTFSYDYDPFPQVCYYKDGKIVSKVLEIDGSEFHEAVAIADVDSWIRFVEDANGLDVDFEEE